MMSVEVLWRIPFGDRCIQWQDHIATESVVHSRMLRFFSFISSDGSVCTKSFASSHTLLIYFSIHSLSLFRNQPSSCLSSLPTPLALSLISCRSAFFIFFTGWLFCRGGIYFCVSLRRGYMCQRESYPSAWTKRITQSPKYSVI